MKNGHRFVDVDMHVLEPPNLFDDFIAPEFKDRISTPAISSNSQGTGTPGVSRWLIDGRPTSLDGFRSQYNRTRGPLISARRNKAVEFAQERGFDAEAAVIAMETEGIDIAVLYPTAGLFFMAPEKREPRFSLAICRAYNDWLYDYCQHSPDQLKMVAMLPVDDVNLACAELIRCVENYKAVGGLLRPNYMLGHYWHSNYWDPLYGILQELDVPLCFHEGTGSFHSSNEERYGENRFLRHVAGHPVEMQMAAVALVLGGIFEFFPNLRVVFVEAQSWWAPGLVGRMELDLEHHKESDAPFLKLSPLEYWLRNCFTTIEGGEKDLGATIEMLNGADNICVGSDFPHFDSHFPEVANRVLENPSITPEIGAKILGNGARLYGFTEQDFEKADAAAEARKDNSSTALRA